LFFVIPIIIIYIVFILNNLAIGIDNKLKSNVCSTSHLKSSNNIVNQTNPPLTSYKAQQRILNIEEARNDLWMHSFKFFLEDLSCSCSHLVKRFGELEIYEGGLIILFEQHVCFKFFICFCWWAFFLKSCQLHSNWAHAFLGGPIRNVTPQIDF